MNKPAPVPDYEPTDIEWAMLAAYVDREGCIKVVKSKGEGRTYPSYKLTIDINSTDPQLIVWLHERFGGCAYSLPLYQTDRKRLPQFRWTVTGNQNKRILENIKKFSVIKGIQIRLALKFLEVATVDMDVWNGLLGFTKQDLADTREAWKMALSDAKTTKQSGDMTKLREVKRHAA